MSLKFTKRKENFVCENCGNYIEGDGYTNHCSKCLWSKHVDVFPGDRAEVCGGLMEPVDVEEVRGELRIIQKCLRCGKINKNKTSISDNFDQIIKIKR